MKAPFNRYVGLIVLDVTMSNPNGDPDMESNPRMLEADNRGVISPVSFKRKLRDLVADESPVFEAANTTLQLGVDGDNAYGILESRGRDRDKIKQMDKAVFKKSFWDARVFGNTFLESMKDDKELKNKDTEHFISTGVIQVGVGLSVAPIDIEMMTLTNKSGVEEGKDRGMAPLAFRVVRHGIYTIPFYINPSIAVKTGATPKDIGLFKFLLPYVYQHTSSAIRPQVSVIHAWFAEHKNPLGSCPEHLLINALTPSRKKDNADIEPSSSIADYEVPEKKDIPETISERFLSIEDLLDKSWS